MIHNKTQSGREVSYLHLIDGATMVPGVGNIGNSLPSPTKTFVLKMVQQAEGVYVNFNNSKAEVLFPWPSIKLLVYKPEAALKAVRDVA